MQTQDKSIKFKIKITTPSTSPGKHTHILRVKKSHGDNFSDSKKVI